MLFRSPEWIELYNFSEHPIEILSGYITDAATSKKISKLKINSYSFLVITKDTSALLQIRNIPPDCQIVEASIPTLNNTTDCITLRNADSTLIDSVYYNMNWGKKGISLERRYINEPAVSSTNWSPSVSPNGATAGYENSIIIKYDTVKALTASPNPFSPFSSEGETVCNISYKLPYEYAKINLTIYDVGGNLIKKIANNELSSVIGNYIWDGRNSDGYNVSVGPYILLLEATDEKSEKYHNEKLMIVVGK